MLRPVLQEVNDIGETFVCPITLRLPFNPVKAEDGFVCDQETIENHFAGKETITSHKKNRRNGSSRNQLWPFSG